MFKIKLSIINSINKNHNHTQICFDDTILMIKICFNEAVSIIQVIK